MSKTTRYEDWHIKVVPDLHGFPPSFTEDPARVQQFMNSIKADIERHVNDIAGAGVNVTRREMCSHCDLPWEVITQADRDANPRLCAGLRVGEPVCCEAAAREWRDQQSPDAN